MKKSITVFFAIMPILSIYTIGYNIDLASFLLMVAFPIVLMYMYNQNSNIRIVPSIITFLAYIFTITCVNIIAEGSFVEINLIVLRLLKFIFFVGFSSIIINSELFDGQYMFKIYKKIAIISSLFIIAQQIIYTAIGIRLDGIFWPLVDLNSLYLNVDYDRAAISFYRPSSFFLEPAHFAQYILFLMVTVVFAPITNSRKTLGLLALILVAVICSTSGQGIGAMLFLLLIAYFLKYGRSVKGNAVFILLILCAATVYISSSYVGNIVDKSILRVIDFDSGNNAILGRTGSYEHLSETNVENLIFGYGFGNVLAGYFNGFSYVIWCIGIVGYILYLNLFYKLFKSGDSVKRVYILLVIAFSLFAQVFTAGSISFMLALLYSENGDGNA